MSKTKVYGCQKEFWTFTCDQCGETINLGRSPDQTRCALCKRHPGRTAEEMLALKRWIRTNEPEMIKKMRGEPYQYTPKPPPFDKEP